jgi:toxin CptA
MMLAGPELALAVVLVALIGFAVQRGATCTVVAVAEIVDHRRVARLSAMLEASLWVAGCILVARALGVTMYAPTTFAISAATIAGGVLLGLGAVINGACVIGAIARFGAGEWAFAATPLGFLLGCFAAGWTGFAAAVSPVAASSPLLAAPAGVAAGFAVFAVIRLGLMRRRHATMPRAPGSHAWTPHAATIVIGVAFALLLLVAGRWAYTEVLADIAAGRTDDIAVRLTLFGVLVAGAVTGGWRAGLLRHRPVRTASVARALAGGFVMALGSLLIPGSNDGLVLLGLPLLLPFAWVAFVVMALTIAVVLLIVPRARMAPPRGR